MEVHFLSDGAILINPLKFTDPSGYYPKELGDHPTPVTSGYNYDYTYGLGGGGFGQAEPNPYSFNNWWNAYMYASGKGYTGGLSNFQQQYFSQDAWSNGKLTLENHYWTQNSEIRNNEFYKVSTKHTTYIAIDLFAKSMYKMQSINNSYRELEYQRELEKYGKLQSNVNISGVFALGGGGAIEFGYVLTNKGFAQYYFSIYTASTISAGVSANVVIINGFNNYQPTISDWEGDCTEAGGNFTFYNSQVGGDLTNKYITYTGGLGIGFSYPQVGTIGAFSGKTYLIGSPINMNSKGFGTRSYEISHGY